MFERSTAAYRKEKGLSNKEESFLMLCSDSSLFCRCPGNGSVFPVSFFKYKLSLRGGEGQQDRISYSSKDSSYLSMCSIVCPVERKLSWPLRWLFLLLNPTLPLAYTGKTLPALQREEWINKRKVRTADNIIVLAVGGRGWRSKY